jgi:hypothetical protein
VQRPIAQHRIGFATTARTTEEAFKYRAIYEC